YGSTFSNLFLKKYSDYLKENIVFVAFKKYLIVLNILGFTFSIIVLFISLIFKVNSVLVMITLLYSILMSNRIYGIVWYRVKINYKIIFVFNLSLAILYLLFSFFEYTSLISVFLNFLIIEVIINAF